MSERRGHFYVVKHRFKADEIRSIKWPGPVDSETIVHLLNMCYYDEPEEEKKNDNLYRKKPIVVEAFQTDEEMLIETLEGTMKAEKGDFIIKGVGGELYPCKEDIFHETYEKVE